MRNRISRAGIKPIRLKVRLTRHHTQPVLCIGRYRDYYLHVSFGSMYPYAISNENGIGIAASKSMKAGKRIMRKLHKRFGSTFSQIDERMLINDDVKSELRLFTRNDIDCAY